MYDPEGDIVGIIEIKAGLDPAGALERLGAMFKSFESTLSEYPEAVTILVASCITKEVDNRLNASMVVRQKYITTDILLMTGKKEVCKPSKGNNEVGSPQLLDLKPYLYLEF